MTKLAGGKKGNLKEKVEILRQVVPFNVLGDEPLQQLASKAVFSTFPAATVILRQGEPSTGTLYIIVSGRTKVVVSGDETQEKVVGYRNPYEFFGVTALFIEEGYPVSVLASEELTCLLLDHEDLEAVMTTNAEFASYFTYELSRRLRGVYQNFMRETQGGSVMETLPLRRKIADVMTSNPVTCKYMDGVKKIAETMSTYNVSSVIITAPNGTPLGIITENDLVKRVLSGDRASPFDYKAYQVMSENLVTITPQEFSFEALLLMAKHSIKHIVVTENRTLAGVITMRDLIRTRQTGALSIVNAIETQQTVIGLVKAVNDIDNVLQALVTERAYASEICPLISEFYDRLTRKIIVLSEEEMQAEYGKIPARYCWINMGSSGRMEQYSRTDQDNGIIFEDLPTKAETEKALEYFLKLGEKVVSGLELCGFKRCDGLVMANNTGWCRSLSNWFETNKKWTDDLEPGNLRNMTIFLDFRFIHGEEELSKKLRSFIAEMYKTANTALLFLAEDDLRHRAPLNLFRQIVTEKSGEHRDQVNLKGAGCVHIVDCVRIFCLQEGIEETPTFKRLAELKRKGVLKGEEIEFVEAAFETLMMFRIRDAAHKMSQGKVPDNYINPHHLAKKEQSLLRESFIVVNRLQNLTSRQFRIYQG